MITRAILETGGTGNLDLLVDRPFVRHVVEQLCRAGVLHVDVFSARDPSALAAELGDGERWGISLRYHDVSGPTGVRDALAESLTRGDAGEVVVGRGDVLVPPATWSGVPGREGSLELYRFGPGNRSHPAWTGWGRTHTGVIRRAACGEPAHGLLDSLVNAARSVTTRACLALAARDGAELFEANLRVLAGDAPFLILHGRCGPDRIWKERGVRVHPSAELRAPVYLGEHVDVGAHAVVGPGAVVGASSVLDSGVIVRNCVIAPATYVARGATVQRLVALHPRGLCRSSGEAVPPAESRALVDLRGMSLTSSLARLLEAGAEWLGEVVRASARLCTSLAHRFWNEPGTAAS